MILLLSVCSVGCVRRDGRNADCAWPGEPDAKSLNAGQPDDARHLARDLEFAEELAIEHMDAHFGPRSRESHPGQTASQALNACLGSLAVKIGESHHVPLKDLRQLFGRRSIAVDTVVSLSFLLAYLVLAGVFAAWLLRRYPPDEGRTATIAMVVLSSLFFGLGGAMAGEQWSTLAENIRVGTGHLSYRVDRLPWVRHQLAFFVLCVLLFWTAAAGRYWAGTRRTSH